MSRLNQICESPLHGCIESPLHAIGCAAAAPGCLPYDVVLTVELSGWGTVCGWIDLSGLNGTYSAEYGGNLNVPPIMYAECRWIPSSQGSDFVYLFYGSYLLGPGYPPYSYAVGWFAVLVDSSHPYGVAMIMTCGNVADPRGKSWTCVPTVQSYCSACTGTIGTIAVS